MSKFFNLSASRKVFFCPKNLIGSFCGGSSKTLSLFSESHDLLHSESNYLFIFAPPTTLWIWLNILHNPICKLQVEWWQSVQISPRYSVWSGCLFHTDTHNDSAAVCALRHMQIGVFLRPKWAFISYSIAAVFCANILNEVFYLSWTVTRK